MPNDDCDLSETVECVLPPFPQTRARSLTLATVTCYSYVGGLQAFYSFAQVLHAQSRMISLLATAPALGKGKDR